MSPLVLKNAFITYGRPRFGHVTGADDARKGHAEIVVEDGVVHVARERQRASGQTTASATGYWLFSSTTSVSTKKSPPERWSAPPLGRLRTEHVANVAHLRGVLAIVAVRATIDVHVVGEQIAAQYAQRAVRERAVADDQRRVHARSSGADERAALDFHVLGLVPDDGFRRGDDATVDGAVGHEHGAAGLRRDAARQHDAGEVGRAVDREVIGGKFEAMFEAHHGKGAGRPRTRRARDQGPRRRTCTVAPASTMTVPPTVIVAARRCGGWPPASSARSAGRRERRIGVRVLEATPRGPWRSEWIQRMAACGRTRPAMSVSSRTSLVRRTAFPASPAPLARRTPT